MIKSMIEPRASAHFAFARSRQIPASKRDYEHMHNNGREPIGGSVAIPRFSTNLIVVVVVDRCELRACKPLTGFPLYIVDYSIITKRPDTRYGTPRTTERLVKFPQFVRIRSELALGQCGPHSVQRTFPGEFLSSVPYRPVWSHSF